MSPIQPISGAAPAPFAAPEAAELVVYRGGSVFDGTGADLQPGTSVVTAGATISAIVADAKVSTDVLDRATVIDLDGRTVIPGLIDCHQHLATPPNRPVAEAALRHLAYGGVTAIRIMADDLRQIADLARAIRVGEIAGPEIRYAALIAGPTFFDDPRTWQVSQGETPGLVPWMQAVTATTDLPIAVALARGTHATAVKIYADLAAELVAAITAEAHRQGLSVWAHAAVYPALPLEVVAASVDVISHVTMLAAQTRPAPPTYASRPALEPSRVAADDPRITEVFELMRARGTILDVTASMWTRDEITSGDAETVDRGRATADLAAELTARAHRLGVAICTGTDYETQPDEPFPALHNELIFLNQRCGMPAGAVLQSATRIAADAAGAGAVMGTLEPGKLADLVILDDNPLADLTNLASISCTVRRGRRLPRRDYSAEGIGTDGNQR